MKSKLEHALELASQGFYVFPIVAGKKAPPRREGWQRMASRNAPEVQGMWAKYPDDNIGISTSKFGDGEALLIVDVDNKGDKHGDEELLRLELEGLCLPGTYAATTPTGGRHLFYRVAAPVRQGANVLAPGLDVRSRGGYVVGVGSTVEAGNYEGARDGHLAPAPDWLLDRCGRPAERTREDQLAPAGVDAAAAAERATHYLRHEAPLAVEGEGGDETTYKVAARLKDFGLSAETTTELLIEHWNSRCEPHWLPNELGGKVNNAYDYGLNPPGNAAPETVFTVVQPSDLYTNGVPPEKVYKPGLRFELFHDVQPDLSHVALIQNLIDHRAMSVVYGDSNTGKTFFALDLGFHISLGRAWHDRKVDPGAVVYVAAEGGGSIRKRVVAFRKHHGLETQRIPFALVPCSVDLLNPRADTVPLIELITAVSRQCQRPVIFIVIDTLARAIGGGNENASEDMGAFVRNVDRIRESAKAHCMIVHHSGKDAAKGARGHSSLRAATDTEIEIADLTARANKQRDQELGKPIGFSLQPVLVGKDAYGMEVSSCVVLPRTVPAESTFRPKPMRPGSLADSALKILHDLQMGGDPVALHQWQDAFIALRYPDMRRETAIRAFERVRAMLGGRFRLDNGWVEEAA